MSFWHIKAIMFWYVLVNRPANCKPKHPHNDQNKQHLKTKTVLLAITRLHELAVGRHLVEMNRTDLHLPVPLRRLANSNLPPPHKLQASKIQKSPKIGNISLQSPFKLRRAMALRSPFEGAMRIRECGRRRGRRLRGSGHSSVPPLRGSLRGFLNGFVGPRPYEA